VKYSQVIDGAENCVYDVFATSEEDHALLFPNHTDIAFAKDLETRSDAPAVAVLSLTSVHDVYTLSE
jgi:hypothetical protein